MKHQDWSDETLMAYADGELDAPVAKEVEAAARADPRIAERIASFGRTRDLLKEAARARASDPLPPQLEAKVRETLRSARAEAPDSSKVTAFRQSWERGSNFRPTTIAASIALAAGLAGGFFVAQNRDGADGLRGAAFPTPEIAGALDTLPSGRTQDVDGGEFQAIASFMNSDGELCREFELQAPELGRMVSVACHSDTGWQQRLALIEDVAPDGGYAPASSLEMLDIYLGSIGAGAPLSSDDEAAALREVAR